VRQQREQQLGCGKLLQSLKHPRIVVDRFTSNEKTMNNEIVLGAGCGTGRVTKK
jgi:hypothetical protein